MRPAYKWGSLGNTIVYSVYKPERKETALILWDTNAGEYYIKFLHNIKLLFAAGDYCSVVSIDRQSISESEDSHIYIIQLRNAIGAIVDTKVLPVGFRPTCGNMSAENLVLADSRVVYVWQFSGIGSDLRSSSQNRERMFDVDTASVTIAQSPELFRINKEPIEDPVTCVAISDKYLVVGRRGGALQRYTLPHLSTENQYFMRSEPYRIELNCTSSHLGYVDFNGAFTILDLEAKASQDEEKTDKSAIGEYFGRKLNVEKRDVWDILWAEDNDEMICIMEKDKLTVFHGEDSEEPVNAYGYLARFKNLEVRSVLLDDLLSFDQMPPPREKVVNFETKGIKEVRDVINSEGLESSFRYAQKNPHPRLWRLLAESALIDGDLSIAEKAFVKSEDYHGVQLVKQLRTMPDRMKMRAEVAAYLGRYDEAEAIYMEIDRRDLAVELRSRMGDFGRVVPLLQSVGASDKQMGEIWDQVGEYYADRFKWRNAAHYFSLAHNSSRLADCLYRAENFDGLIQLSQELSEGAPLLSSLASKFESVGLCAEAVDCYLKAGNPKAAVDCCVTQNRWDRALELAEEHSFPQVEGLLNKYAASLIAKGKQLEAVELFRRANRPTEAALLIGEIAELAARQEVKPGLAKKLHILGALEIERHRKKTVEQATLATLNNTGGTLAQATAATLDTLMMTALPTQNQGNTTLTGVTGNKRASKGGGGAWRGAAAYHYYMLAQKQLYSGNFDGSMKTSIKLCEYDDILEPRDIYAILVLASMANAFYGICSKAFVKLETLQEMPDEDRDQIQTLAVKIFSRHTPTDPVVLPEPYLKCLDMGKPYKACVITGR